VSDPVVNVFFVEWRFVLYCGLLQLGCISSVCNQDHHRL